MTYSIRPWLALAAALCILGPASPSRAAINTSGNVEPDSPATWTSYTDGYIGKTSNGSLTVNANSDILSSFGYIGYNSGVTGTVTVDGPGSTWTNNRSLCVGSYGSGTLTITAGGAVSNLSSVNSSYLGYLPGSTGAVAVDGAGSTLSNNGAFHVGFWGSGTLSITAGGVVSNTYNPSHVAYLGGSRAVVTVEGAGSTWNNSDLYVGNAGEGALHITAGGRVTSKIASICDKWVGAGVVTVDGPGSQWNNSDRLYVGFSGKGTLTISGGGEVSSASAYVGYNTTASSLGVATVVGAGSTWTNSAELGVGYYGNGRLNITAGGAVSNSYGHVGYHSGSTGVVKVDGPGSTWTNGGDLLVGESGHGSLNIAGGATVVSSAGYVSGSKSVVTVDGAGSKWTNSDNLYVGNTGSGTLNITAGGAVSNRYGEIGVLPYSVGAVTVDGAGSTWTTSNRLCVGHSGSATLTVTAGGTVSNDYGHIGYTSFSEAVCVATVDGAGSTWTNRSTLYVGDYSKGTLNVSNGGAVTAATVSINSQSLLAIDVGSGSKLTVGNGTGTLTNNGKVRVLATAGAVAGATYSPIAAGTWSGTGSTQAVGGTWNATPRQFTVSEVQEGAAATQLTIDLLERQRLKVYDNTTHWSLGASFPAATSSKSLKLTPMAISGVVRTRLEEFLDPGEVVLGGWQFSIASGYTAGEPAYLSFDVGPGFTRSDFSVWRITVATWTSYAAADLTYDGRYASFSVSELKGFAISAVPEPGALALLAGAMLALPAAALRWKRMQNDATLTADS